MLPDVRVAGQVNWAQHRPGHRGGHYESYYLRANDPDRPLAVWLRYTVFSPDGRPERAVGEVWAVVFDGARGGHTVARSAFAVLAYDNPPGGVRYCLNTKIAQWKLSIVDTATGRREEHESAHGAMFEILTDDPPEIPVQP